MATLLFFGKFADLAGAGEVQRTLADGDTVAALVARLADENPALGVAMDDARVRFAVNDRICDAGAAVSDRDEIAFLPPVSGGDHQCAAVARRQIRLAHARFDPAAEQATFFDGLSQSGAVASFVGLVRGRAADGAAVQTLVLDHHPRLTEASLLQIADDAQARWPLEALSITHRVGRVEAGEAVVQVLTASAHRRAAFEAVDYLMDRLKTEALFWKREEGPNGSRWIEPRADDYADAQRWAANEDEHD